MPIELTNLLKEWGMTIGLLAVAATALAALLVLSLREFAFWFLRINVLVKNQKDILARLESIERGQKLLNAKEAIAIATEKTQAPLNQFPLEQPKKPDPFTLNA